MTHQINWYMGNRIIYAIIDSDSLTQQTMCELNNQLVAFIGACASNDGQGVHIIIDASRVKKFHVNAATIHAGFAFAKLPSVKWNVLISDNPNMRYLRMLITRVGKVKLRSFEALEEALFFLQDEDRTLQMPFWCSYEPAVSL